MTRLIDADALLERINYKAESGMGKTIAFTFKHFIEDAPTIDAISRSENSNAKTQNSTQNSNGDLIFRADAMGAVQKVWCDNDDQNDFKQRYYEMGNNDAVEDALGEIEKLPAVVASTEFLISRYDAKDKAKEIMYSILDDTDYNDIESMAHACLMMKIKILKMFDALPSAEAKTKCIAQIKVDTEEIVSRIKEEYDIMDGWIPCSERLPLVTDQEVLATTIWGDVTIANRCTCDDWFIHEGNSNAKTSDIIAWMPLPTPYTKGNNK